MSNKHPCQYASLGCQKTFVNPSGTCKSRHESKCQKNPSCVKKIETIKEEPSQSDSVVDEAPSIPKPIKQRKKRQPKPIVPELIVETNEPNLKRKKGNPKPGFCYRSDDQSTNPPSGESGYTSLDDETYKEILSVFSEESSSNTPKAIKTDIVVVEKLNVSESSENSDISSVVSSPKVKRRKRRRMRERRTPEIPCWKPDLSHVELPDSINSSFDGGTLMSRKVRRDYNFDDLFQYDTISWKNYRAQRQTTNTMKFCNDIDSLQSNIAALVISEYTKLHLEREHLQELMKSSHRSLYNTIQYIEKETESWYNHLLLKVRS